MSHLMLVPVPGGRTASGDGLLRVVVVPLLDDGGSLASHGLADWPPAQLSAEGALVVEIGPQPSNAPPVAVTRRPVVDSVEGLWEQFFGSITVRAPGDPVARTTDVQRTTQQAAAVVGAYRETARALTGEDARPSFDAMSRDRAGTLAGLVPPPLPPGTTPGPPGRTIDFHLATSVLREHPSVLRALGLILELTVPQPDFAGSGTGVVRVRWPAAPAPLPQIRSPWTRFVRSRFLPAPGEGSDIHSAGGMVALARQTAGRRLWRLHTVDVDHALRGLEAAAAPDGAGVLPALRTAGVLLARVGRSDGLTARGRRSGQSPEELDADHLTLGYRVDARIFGDDWHSLVARRARYAVNGVEFASGLTEEGHVKVGGGLDHGDKVLRTDEVVARWDGWSLAVPRPQLHERAPGETTPSIDLPFRLDTSRIEVEPGSLLRLRFGEDYQVRVRVADIAGGGPELADASLDGCDSDLVRFRRLEPVLPPDVRVPEGSSAFGAAVSEMALVIRTAEGIADTVADTTRELVPPSATFEVIERHGRLDGPPDDSLTLLARRELPDPAAGGVVGFVRGEPGGPPRDLEAQDWASSRPGPPPEDPWPDLRTKRVVLRARQDDGPTLHWETDDLLVVALSPAEEATLELSSLIAEGAKKAFSISDWLTGDDLDDDDTDQDAGAVAEAEDQLASGRHPMATPAHRLTVRHAVRAPRGEPRGDLVVTREEGATWGTIEPPEDADDPLVGVDAASTLSVDVAASWHPVDDTLDPGGDLVPVGRIDVGRSDERVTPLQHEFGDTKHRMVTYTWTAHSRFRDCFPATEDPAGFQRTGTIGPIPVLSTARPVVPVIRSVTPAFVWTQDPDSPPFVRHRLGGRLRVELEPPWFTTGDGERLAVLCATGTPGEAEASFVTQAARDPLWSTGVPSRFLAPIGEVQTVTLAEGPTVQLVAVGVFEAAGSAYADIVFPATSSYAAMVQLAVARYQPNSLDGLALSPVVRSDFVPLLPDRTLSLGRVADDEVFVKLDGLAPSGPRVNRVDVVVEQRVSPGDAGGSTLTLGADGAWQFFASASGTVDEDLFVAVPASDGVRIRVREVEFIGRDTNPALGTVGELQERVVFTDTVPLPL